MSIFTRKQAKEDEAAQVLDALMREAHEAEKSERGYIASLATTYCPVPVEHYRDNAAGLEDVPPWTPEYQALSDVCLGNWLQ